MLGIAIGLTGGMVVETLGYKLLQGNTESLWYKLEVSVEEFMEMFGASLVLLGALKLRLSSKVAARDSSAAREFKLERLATL